VTFHGEEPHKLGGRFTVEREVGRGGVGIVYRAWDLASERPVALKVIGAEAGVAPAEEARLAREGKLLGELDHPGIVKIVAAGMFEDTGQPYVAMEWLEGEDLTARQRRQPLNLTQAVELGIFVAEALEAAHKAGVVHRDIKPGNVFLCRQRHERARELDAFPKLVDFGVATAESGKLTHAEDVVGTPAYMAPEQARGDAPIDQRCDVYSLGATLFEVLAGRPPHVGPTAFATLARLVATPAPRLGDVRPGIPDALDELVARMLATDPDERPSSAREVAQQLTGALDAEPARYTLAPGSAPGHEPVLSSRLGSSATRLVTSIVATRLASSSARERALEMLRRRGADAVPLGQDAIVAHLGARRALGAEAATALELGRRLAQAGARVGIASGRARVSLASPGGMVTPVGEVVDRAATLARDAQPGSVIADATTSELGRGRWEFKAREDGSSIVGEAHRVTRDRAGGSPFVGREPELAQILSAFERVRADSTPLLVSVTGPPGIGKTRLRREVMTRILAQADPPHLVFQRSDAYARGHALGAAADVLRSIVELPKGVSVAEAERAIVSRLGPKTRSELSHETRPVLARLLANEPLPEGLDPRGARDVLWLAMTDLVLQVIASQTTAVVLEDLQWADPESVGWLDHMLGRASHQRLLVLALVRPSFWSDYPGRFASRDHVKLELRPISDRATRAIARALLGEKVSEETLERIAAQAGGLPLFAEELARLTAAGRDTTRAPTLEAAIQVSLDALDDECRDALGRLSVFGSSVWDAGLEALGIPQAEGVMRALAANEMLVEQSSSRFSGSREWVFTHALVREVAYTSLGEAERRELHALAARWLASMGEDAAVVAGHFDLGGEHAAAAIHWERAARRALATNALTDALRMADRALAFAEDKPSGFQRASYLDEAWSRLDPRASDRETAIRALQENVHDEASAVRARGAEARWDEARGAGTDVTERLARVRDEAAALGLWDEEARCSAPLATRLAFAGRFAEAEQEATRLIELAQRRGVHAAAVDAWQTLAIVRQTQGAVAAALQARRNAATAARSAGLKEREAMLTTNLGFALTTLGARQEARASLEAGLALADAIGSVGAVRHAQMNLLGWAASFGSDRRLDAHLSDTRADADAAASGLWTSPDRSNLGVLFYRGWELLRAKQDSTVARALALLKLAAEGYRQTQNRDVLPVALGLWAEAERRNGNVARALDLAAEGAALLEAGAPSLLNESTVYLVLHQACVDSGRADAARDAVARGVRPLLRRVQGLSGTPYARSFLLELPDNAALLAAAEGHGLVPDPIHRVLEHAR
jgi:tetratricopeptide (TPR) repeat protein